jgi:leucyl aminopeptidase
MPSPANLLPATAKTAIPVTAVSASDWQSFHKKLPAAHRAWADAQGFEAQSSRHLILPSDKGGIARVLTGNSNSDPFNPGRLASALPKGAYRFDDTIAEARLAALGWLLEAYRFERYRKSSNAAPQLVCPPKVDRAELLNAAAAVWLTRDLVNTPSSDMGPGELEAAARQVAKEHNAKLAVTRGAKLERDFPMIHAVGKASPRSPRLIDFTWGPARAPKVTLVGKGVCFDTGGLDIKPSAGMLLMKKDMGGAANVLGLARMIMTAKLPVRLRVLIPAVENSISGNAFRPGDILHSRKGLTVEIGNTDAEGRLVLADALALADEESPDLLIDMATLTGAARVALGPDLPPFYSRDDAFAETLARHAKTENDPLWRMPLWDPYMQMMEGRISDLNNASESSFAGSITAALFLARFVEKAKTYAHFDIFAWTPVAKPGRPRGGEAQGLRALYALISERYAKR